MCLVALLKTKKGPIKLNGDTNKNMLGCYININRATNTVSKVDVSIEKAILKQGS